MSMTRFDKAIGYLSPERALRRVTARNLLAFYEAAQPSKQRKFRTDASAPNVQVQRAASALRVQARHLEQNHDIARGILRTMTNNIVGASGIGIEPQPRSRDGSIHEDYARALLEAWRDWVRTPEVTHTHHWAKVQRLLARSWLRDGEVFVQMLTGPVAMLDHGTRVPFSLELVEADLIPHAYDDPQRGIRQGIERNAWGRPRGYHCFKTHPGELAGLPTSQDTKRIEAANMLHIACIDRIGQLRGVSEFAAVIARLEDIKDYEESERVAAKIAAMLTAYVKRGTPDMVSESAGRDEYGNPIQREIKLQPGSIIDTLGIGEEIGLIDSKRPNPNVVTFRQGQLRAVAAGVGASYSSIARDYDGTYSAQRQELVEQWVNYATLTDEFVGQCIQPVWERFVLAAHLSGAVPMPRDLRPGTHDDALYLGQSMPWIDPMKEANAWTQLVKAGFASEVEVMRKRGVNPSDVLEQIAAWRKRADDHGLKFASDAANDQPEPPPEKAEREDDKAIRQSALALLASAARRDEAPPDNLADLAFARELLGMVKNG